MSMDLKIGKTPLIKIYYQYQGVKKHLYAKLEYYNLTGSIKDRVAYYIITRAKQKGVLKEHMPILEATSGNTGISLAALGAYFGHPVYIYMPDWVSKERVQLMQSFGAYVTLFSKEQGGFSTCIKECAKKAKQSDGFLANQFANSDNTLAHYETTGREIVNQMTEPIGGFVSGVGSGGTLMGVGKRLKEKNSDVKIVAIEPEKMALLSGRKSIGNHKIQGIGDDFVPQLIDKNFIDEIFLINDEDAIQMASKIAKTLGLGVGISSGANFLGSLLLSEQIENPVVTIFADDNKKYLSTELGEQKEENKKFLSHAVALLGYEVVE